MASIINATNTSSGIALTPDSSGVLALQTAGTTALTIDASQNVQIGSNGGTSKLNVFNDSGISLYNTAGTSQGVINTGTTLAISNYTSTGAAISFSTNPNGGSGTERMRIDSSGNALITSSGGLGYGTGSGGTVTQLTSRGTAVTINKLSGSITLVSAPGGTSWSAFVVNNSLVGANDTVILTSKSGATNSYLFYPLGISAGSFQIYFQTTGGTATDTPTVNFTVIKGATS
jgi:hypothetical protein